MIGISSKGVKMINSQEIKAKLEALKLKSCSENFDRIMSEAISKNWTPIEIFGTLLDMELEHKRQNRMALRYKDSKLSEKPTIDGFDFSHHHSRKKQKAKILNLMSLEFIEQKKDVILIGNPGVGKSFLGKCMAYEATMACKKVLFTTAMDMINHLIAAEADKSLLKKLKYYVTPALLVCDEVGYLPMGREGSNLFFQVISARHEKKSTIITTNLPFAQWGKIFDSTTIAQAIADRLVNKNTEVLILEGESYRKKAH